MALKIKINGQKVSAMFTMLIYTCSEYTEKIIYSDFIQQIFYLFFILLYKSKAYGKWPKS